MNRLSIAVALWLVPAWLAAQQPELVSVAKIWDAGKHNAFTDLIRWHDKWYCTFRESDAHVGGDGRCGCWFQPTGTNGSRRRW